MTHFLCPSSRPTRAAVARSQTSRSRRRGVGLLELLLSVSIASMLLVAVAAAYNGSVNAIQVNDSFFRCSQAARVTLMQITAEIRQADATDMSVANTIKIIRAPERLVPNENYRIYKYDTTNQRVTLQIIYTGAIPPSP